MLISIANVPEGCSTKSTSIVIDIDNIDEIHWLDEVECTAEIERIGTRFQIRITYTSQIEIQCSRCLNYFKQPANGVVFIVFESGPDFSFTNLSEDEYSNIEYNRERQEVDLTPAVFDEIITNLSMKPLCSPECSGGEFGLDEKPTKGLSENKENEIDPRWDGLKKLKEKFNSN